MYSQVSRSKQNQNIRRILTGVAVIVLAAAVAVPRASAGVIFSDNFEGGALSSSNWQVLGHGQIVADPLNAGNHVLSFSQLGFGGDIFTVPLDLSAPVITVSFDYLGVDGTTGVGTDTGGFMIQDLSNSFLGYSILGTSSAGSPVFPNMLGLTPGVWHHISITYDPATYSGGAGSKLAFEEWGSSPNTPGNAYFDNIQVSTAPEPVTGALLGGALLAILGFRWLRAVLCLP